MANIKWQKWLFYLYVWKYLANDK